MGTSALVAGCPSGSPKPTFVQSWRSCSPSTHCGRRAIDRGGPFADIHWPCQHHSVDVLLSLVTIARRVSVGMAIATLPVFLTGCARIFVTSETEAPFIDATCVDRAIRQVPEVRDVRHTSELGRAQTGSASIKTATLSHQWTYYSDEPAYIELTRTGSSWKLVSTVMGWGTPWSPTDLDAVSPTMARINAAMARHCKLPVLRTTGVYID